MKAIKINTLNKVAIKTNTALFTLDLAVQCEADLIINMLDTQYQSMFGTKMSRISREKAFKTTSYELFSYYIDDALAA